MENTMKIVGHDAYQVAFSYKCSVMITPTARIRAEEMLFKNRASPLFHEWQLIDMPPMSMMSGHLKNALAKN